MVIHGSWCKARTWPTTCLSCETRVWYFSCECGSRVFFDELGVPWPIHDCETSWLRDIARVIESDGSIRIDLTENISAIRPARYRSQPTLSELSSSRVRLISMDPVEPLEVQELYATLGDVTQGYTIQRELGLPDTAIVSAFLRNLGSSWQRTLGRITLLKTTSSIRHIERYIAMIPASLINDHRSKVGSQVHVILSSIGLSSRQVWVCTHLSIE